MLEDSDSVWVEQLAVPFTALSELKLEAAFFVEYLYPVVVGVGYDDVILSVDCYAARLGKLSCDTREKGKEFSNSSHNFRLQYISLNFRLGWAYISLKC